MSARPGEVLRRHDPQHDAAQSQKLRADELKAFELRHVRQQQAVLQTVQVLKDAAAKAEKDGKHAESVKKFEEIIVLIEAALKHDQAQPWMYEMLAMSMKAAGHPQADFKRAIMSAVEFSQNSMRLNDRRRIPGDADMKPEALRVFQQVSRAEPLWAEPYLCGLMVGATWMTLPDWSGRPRALSDRLGRLRRPRCGKTPCALPMPSWRPSASSSGTRRLTASKRPSIRPSSATASVRVHGLGDADIDLTVKEPGGTAGLLRNQRTTSGGMLIGDLPHPEGKEKLDGHTAVYSCPMAFSGPYQVLIRRVFGNVPTGNVRVVLDMHYNTPQAKQTVWEKIPVKDGESLVKFDLSDGRRKESVREAQIANAAVAALGVRQQQAILAQQLAALNDPNAANALAVTQQNAASAGAVQTQQISPLAWPNGLRGAVGYSPVITVLPEGTNMGCAAVVSGDRRYVRVAPSPMFSAISQVHTFSIDSGATNSTPGVGTGGQGFSGASNGAGALGGAGGGGGFGGGGLGGGGLGGGGLF